MVKKGIVTLVVTVVTFLVYLMSFQAAREFRVAFLDVGQGDGTLITFNNGEKMLVDCGPDRAIVGELGRQISWHDRTIDYLLITHFDIDHYGGCIDVLKRYKVKQVLTNGDSKPGDPFWQAWHTSLKNEGAEEIVVTLSSTLRISDVAFSILWPDPGVRLDEVQKSSNNNSIVFMLHANEDYLFTGDIEDPVEKILLGKYCQSSSSSTLDCPKLRADVLKIAHHGSDTSSGEKFLRAVSPRKVVISSGKTNRFGHPSHRVIKRLERMEALILRTDKQGAILMP